MPTKTRSTAGASSDCYPWCWRCDIEPWARRWVGSERTPNLAGLSADSWPDRQLGIDRQRRHDRIEYRPGPTTLSTPTIGRCRSHGSRSSSTPLIRKPSAGGGRPLSTGSSSTTFPTTSRSDRRRTALPVFSLAWAPEPKLTKNRLHLDLRPDNRPSEVERLLDLGRTRADVGQGDVSWVVLADPEGSTT